MTKGPRRGCFRLVAILLALLLLAAVALFSWGGRRMHEAVELSRHATESFNQLQQQFPFAVPAQEVAPAEARLKEAFNIRKQAHERLTPGLKGVLKEALELRDFDQAIYAYPRWMARLGELQKLLDATTAELQADRMSPKEFSWLLGQPVAYALKQQKEGAAAGSAAAQLGATYSEIFKKAEQVTSDSPEPFEAEAYYEMLLDQYHGNPVAPAWSVTELAAADKPLQLLDLLIAGGQLVDDASLNPSALPNTR